LYAIVLRFFLIKLFIRFRIINQYLCGLKAGGVFGCQRFQFFYNGIYTHRIGITERTTTERREADAENSAHIAIERVGNNAFLQTVSGFVHHAQCTTVYDFFLSKLLAAFATKKFVCLGVYFAMHFLAFIVIQVKTFFVFPAAEARFKHLHNGIARRN
jgi:hypothetical protein